LYLPDGVHAMSGLGEASARTDGKGGSDPRYLDSIWIVGAT